MAAFAPPSLDFAELLAQKAPVRRLGDLRLTYAPSRLVGERLPALRSGSPSWLLGTALALGVGAGALALAPSTSNGFLNVGLTLGVLAALLASGAVWSERRQRARRGFVLYFATELLRLDGASRLRGRPRTVQLPFDAVRAVEVAHRPGRDGYQLVVEVRQGGAFTWEVLADEVRADEEGALLRLQNFLQRAFGLRPVPE